MASWKQLPGSSSPHSVASWRVPTRTLSRSSSPARARMNCHFHQRKTNTCPGRNVAVRRTVAAAIDRVCVRTRNRLILQSRGPQTDRRKVAWGPSRFVNPFRRRERPDVFKVVSKSTTKLHSSSDSMTYDTRINRLWWFHSINETLSAIGQSGLGRCMWIAAGSCFRIHMLSLIGLHFGEETYDTAADPSV